MDWSTIPKLLSEAKSKFADLAIAHPSEDEVRLETAHEIVYIETKTGFVRAEQKTGKPPLLVTFVFCQLYPGPSHGLQLQQAFLAMAQELHTVKSNMATISGYTAVVMADVERRLTLMQDTCDSACAQVAQLQEEIGSRARAPPDPEPDPFLAETGEDDSDSGRMVF